MQLEINKIYHQYIIKVVLFSLFLYRRKLRQPEIYKKSVFAFLEKRLNWKIYLSIDTGFKLEKSKERNLILDDILTGQKTTSFDKIKVKFLTPLKSVELEVDLSDDKRYEKLIYS